MRVALAFLLCGLAVDIGAQPAVEWGSLPPLPVARYCHGMVAVNGVVYVVAGKATGGPALQSVYAYESATNRWVERAPLPREGSCIMAAAIGDKIYVVGGESGPDLSSRLDIYDTKNDVWTGGPAMPAPKALSEVATLDGKLYVVSGLGPTRAANFSRETYVYDPATSSWSTGPRLIVPRQNALMVSTGRALWTLGGSGAQEDFLDSIEVYEPRRGAWKMAPLKLEFPTAGLAGAAVGQRIFVAGGTNRSGEGLIQAGSIDRAGWHEAPAMPFGVSMSRAAAVGTIVYFSGGTRGGAIAYDDFSSYDLATGIWKTSRMSNGFNASGPPRIEARPYRQSAAATANQDQDLQPSPPFAQAHPDDYALVVGIENYQSVPHADYGERDAAAFKRFAVSRLGVPEENVITLLGSQATRTNIAKYVEEWLPRNTTASSRVYFYFSGHGAPDPERGTAYLMPWDGDPSFLNTSGYSLARLYEKLQGLPAREEIAFLDACFSGAGGRSVIAKGLRPLVNVKAAPMLRQHGKLSVLSAASGQQVAGSLDAQRHGLFTYNLVKGLSGEADVDGHIDLSDLFGYVSSRVRREAHRQNRDQDPQLQTSDPSLKLY